MENISNISETKVNKISDSDIMKICTELNLKEKAIEIIILKYQKRLYSQLFSWLKNHDDVEDVSQMTFIKVWQNLQNFKSDSSLYTWIYKISLNEASNFLNKKKKYAVDDIGKSIEKPYIVVNESDAKKIEKVLSDAIDALPTKQKRVFELRYYNETSYKKIAKDFSANESTLKATYFVAKSKIIKYVDRNLPNCTFLNDLRDLSLKNE
ncbi:MAG: sigma-70 family RNA polymerase sigma factor [Candidatus Izemoplasmatales bacterium]